MNRTRNEALAALAYFAVYVVWLTWHRETELEHWLGLVLIPGGIVFAAGGRGRLTEFLLRLGLSPARIRRGLGWSLALGLLFQCLQLLNREQAHAITEVLATPWGWVFVPLALLLLLATVATTEEFFFRGLMQSSLTRWSGNAIVGIGVTTFLFAVYHIPYAYFGANWPSHGDLGRAISAGFANGGLAGLALGFVRARSGNLFAAMLLHALVNLIPATLLVAGLFGR